MVSGLQCGVKGDRTVAELRKHAICLLLVVWPWTAPVPSLEFRCLLYQMKQLGQLAVLILLWNKGIEIYLFWDELLQ